MKREKFHQSSNGIGKWNEVKETSVKNLARDLDVETIIEFVGGKSTSVKGNISGKLIFNEDGSFSIVEE